MSSDEKQRLDNDEIDLGGLFRCIWFHKFSLLILIILSVPVSIMYSNTIPPTYKAETVFERPENKSPSRDRATLSDVNYGFLSFLGGANLAASNSFYSEIRSSSFLKTVILNNPKLDGKTIRSFCSTPSKKDYGFSLRSLLIIVGISQNKSPSENQKTSLLVKCVNDMLEIQSDSYGQDQKSSAYRLSITSANPDFSAALANQIVEKYFVRHEESRDQNFERIKKYLSEVISETQLEYNRAKKLMQSFKIKNTLLMNIPTSSPQRTLRYGQGSASYEIPTSPFEIELNTSIGYLSQLEKSLSRLKQVKMNLSKLRELDQEKIKTFLSSTEVQEVISRTFVTSISKIDDLSAGTNFKQLKIKNLVSEELLSLEQQIQVLEDKKGKREEKVKKLMVIENNYQELAIDVSKKKMIFEGLKDQLKEKIITTGLSNVEQPVLLTEAVPPFTQNSPNKKLIVAMGGLLSILVGMGYVLIRQLFVRRIYSLSQLKNINKFLSYYHIKYSQLKLTSERSDKTEIDQSFFSHAKQAGSLGCIIDLSQKTKNNSLALTFFKSIASFLVADGTKIVYLDDLQNNKAFSAKSEENFISDRKVLDAQSGLNKHIFILNDEDDIINLGNVNQVKTKYSEFDKIICALDKDVADRVKFKFIEQCDFYILIGKSFQFDEYTFKKFAHTNLEKENKCLGCFLID